MTASEPQIERKRALWGGGDSEFRTYPQKYIVVPFRDAT